MSRKDRRRAAHESMNFFRAIIDGVACAAEGSDYCDPDAVLDGLKEAFKKAGIDRRLSFVLRLSANWQLRPMLKKIRKIFRRKQAIYEGQSGQVYQYARETTLRSLKSKYKRLSSDTQKKEALKKTVIDVTVKIVRSALQGKPIVQQQMQVRMR